MKKVRCSVGALKESLSKEDQELPIKILLTNKDETKLAFISLVSSFAAEVPIPDGKTEKFYLLQGHVSDEYFDTPLSRGDE